MASFSWGKLPARHTKVDENQRPLKTGSHGCRALKNDITSPKPCSQGRDGTEEFQKGGACVVCCGNKRCKTCDHIFLGSSFTSNVTGRCYNVIYLTHRYIVLVTVPPLMRVTVHINCFPFQLTSVIRPGLSKETS